MKTPISTIVLFISLHTLVHAQFRGDVFFPQAATSVTEGETFELPIEAFLGSDPFGAIHLEMNYDPEVVEITGFANSDWDTQYFLLREDGVVRVIVTNGEALDGPIGTISLPSIRGVAVGDLGDSTSIQLTSLELLTTGGASVQPTNGFAASVSITGSASAPPQLAVKTVLSTGHKATGFPFDLAKFCRPGMPVTLDHETPDGRRCATSTRYINPEAPSDLVRAKHDSFQIELADMKGSSLSGQLAVPFNVASLTIKDRDGVGLFGLKAAVPAGKVHEVERSLDGRYWERTGLRVESGLHIIELQDGAPGQSAFFRLNQVEP